MTLEQILTRHAEAVRHFEEEGSIEDDELFAALYEHWLHEMPYGTAKARSGDPYEWIEERLEKELR